MLSKCFHCNGYYGSSFGQPVCATCHMFLYADESPRQSTYSHFHDKVDDGDSGNEEPRESSECHLPLSGSSMNDLHESESPLNETNESFPVSSEDNFTSHTPKDHLKDQACSLNCNISQPAHRGTAKVMKSGDQSLQLFTQNSEKLKVSSESRPCSSMVVSNWLTTTEEESFPKTSDGAVILKIPPEVLLVIFQMLDEVSLWSVGQVCRLWNQLVRSTFNSEWKVYTRRRWPLFSALYNVSNWHKVFTFLIESAPCQLCFLQIPYNTNPPDHENSWRKNRLSGELRTLRSDPPEGIAASPLDIMSLHWQASIRGPAGSPYQGGTYFLYIRIPSSYPLKPPLVRFITKIFHPNVSRHGDIGIDSIQHNWSLALTISKVLISIQSLLTDPYTKVCMESQIGDMYDNNRLQFDRIARAWTWRYAMHDAIDPESMIPEYLQHLTSDQISSDQICTKGELCHS